ncbi:MAG: hypothetical protein LKJ76_10450 [Lachnospiraceae bacterium]|nr:hypothetical protein [Lachnospiraceae bacterium]
MNVDRVIYRTEKEEPKDTVDILFAGDSLAYFDFSTRTLWDTSGIASSELGYKATHLCDTYATLATVLQRQKPRAVILEINSFFRRPGVKMQYTDGASNHTKDAVVYNTYSDLFPIFRYHSLFRFWTDPYGKDLGATFHGFVGVDKAVALKKIPDDYTNKKKKKEEILEENLVYLNKIRDLCKAHHTALILVGAPSPVNWDYGEYKGTSEWAKANRVRYIDMNLPEYNDRIGIDWKTDTYDEGDHLNKRGAAKVIDYLGKYLRKKYKLPDRRKDKRYANWDNGVAAAAGEEKH